MRVMLQGDVPNPFNPPDGCRFPTRCPHAQARCSAEEPDLREAAGSHRAAGRVFATLPPPAIVARSGPPQQGRRVLQRTYFVSGQPLSFGVKNAVSPGTTASCL